MKSKSLTIALIVLIVLSVMFTSGRLQKIITALKV